MLKGLSAVTDMQKSILAFFACGDELFTSVDFLHWDDGRKGAKLLENRVEMWEIFNILFEIGVAARGPEGSVQDFLHKCY